MITALLTVIVAVVSIIVAVVSILAICFTIVRTWRSYRPRPKTREELDIMKVTEYFRKARNRERFDLEEINKLLKK